MFGHVFPAKDCAWAEFWAQKGSKRAYFGPFQELGVEIWAVFPLLRARRAPAEKFSKIFFTKKILGTYAEPVEEKFPESDTPGKISRIPPWPPPKEGGGRTPPPSFSGV